MTISQDSRTTEGTAVQTLMTEWQGRDVAAFEIRKTGDAFAVIFLSPVSDLRGLVAVVATLAEAEELALTSLAELMQTPVEDAGAISPELFPHLVYFEMIDGDPLTVGPFGSYVEAWGYLDGGPVDEDLYDRAWVQPLTSPVGDPMTGRDTAHDHCEMDDCTQPGHAHVGDCGATAVLCRSHCLTVGCW